MANTDDPAWIGSHWEEMYNDIYDDINELLDDMVYDDNDMYESEDPTWISRVREEMAPHQALAAFHLVCFAITPFVSTGLFRHVYLMKSATWSLAALLAISAFANLQLLFDAQVTDHQAATVGIVLRRLQAMSLALDEFLTAILLHELFACVTKAEIRPYDAGATWKKTARRGAGGRHLRGGRRVVAGNLGLHDAAEIDGGLGRHLCRRLLGIWHRSGTEEKRRFSAKKRRRSENEGQCRVSPRRWRRFLSNLQAADEGGRDRDVNRPV